MTRFSDWLKSVWTQPHSGRDSIQTFSFRDWLESVWTNRWSGFVLAVLGTILTADLFYFVPSPGVSVALMAGVAVILSLRTKATGTEKATWMVMISALLVLEIAAIKRDRAIVDFKHENEMKEERENFKKVLDDNNHKFTAAMDRSNILMARVSKTLKTTTGGDSFCFLEIATDDSENLVCEGNYPVYDLRVSVDDQDAVRVEEPKHLKLPDEDSTYVGNIGVTASHAMPGLVPLDRGQAHFELDFVARNGGWQELLRYRRIKGNLAKAILVVGDVGSRTEILFRYVSSDYPPDDLSTDFMWRTMNSDLPMRHRKEDQ